MWIILTRLLIQKQPTIALSPQCGLTTRNARSSTSGWIIISCALRLLFFSSCFPQAWQPDDKTISNSTETLPKKTSAHQPYSIPIGDLSCPVAMPSDGKESTCNVGDLGSIPGMGRSPRRGHGNPLQYSCLENSHRQVRWGPWGCKESDTTEWLSTAHVGS